MKILLKYFDIRVITIIKYANKSINKSVFNIYSEVNFHSFRFIVIRNLSFFLIVLKLLSCTFVTASRMTAAQTTHIHAQSPNIIKVSAIYGQFYELTVNHVTNVR